MRQRLLSVLAAAALFLSAATQLHAYEWTAPQPQGSKLAAGVDFYLFNTGAGQFLGGSGPNTWGTRGTLGEAGVTFQFETVSEEDGTYHLKLTGTVDHFKNAGTTKDKDVTNTYVFRDGTTIWLDRNNQDGWTWLVEQAEETNAVRLTVYADDATYGEASDKWGQYIGFDGNSATVDSRLTEDSEGASIDWLLVEQAVYEAYLPTVPVNKAKLSLLAIINMAEAQGMDVSKYTALLDRADVSVEELQAAEQELSKLALDNAIRNSSPSQPFDITNYVLVNPAFDSGNIDGWTVTDGIGQNQGYQSNQVYTNGDISISGFIEAWKPGNAPLGDGSISQRIAGLPEGRYLLECDGIATNQASGFDLSTLTGVYLFYDNGSFVLTSDEPLATENGKPEHLEFEFDYDGAEAMVIGLMTKNTNANWMAADNFRLSAIGPVQTPPAYTALRTLVNNCESIIIEKAQESVIQAFEEAIDAANALIKANPSADRIDEYNAANATLTAAREDLLASVAAYEQLYQLFTEQAPADAALYAAKSTAEGDAFARLAAKLQALANQSETDYADALVSAADIAQRLLDYQKAITDGIAEAKAEIRQAFVAAAAAGTELEKPIDISILFGELEYPYSSTIINTDSLAKLGWHATDVVKFEGGGDGFKSQYATAEVWNATFEVSRVMEGLPRGKYTVRTNAFFRTAENQTNYDTYQSAQGEYAFLYAGNQQAAIANVATLARTETWGSGSAEIEGTDGTLFVPNNQYSAYLTFTDAAQGAPATQVEVASTVVNDGGNLIFGVRGIEGLEANSWVVWGNFSLLYHGVSTSALDADLAALIAKAEAADPCGVQDGYTKLADAIAAGEAAYDGDAAAKSAAINLLTEAISYADLCYDRVMKLRDVAIDYSKKMQELAAYRFSDEAYINLYETIQGAIATDTYDSVEQIEAWITALDEGWIPYIFSREDIATASEDKPADITLIMANADLSTATAANYTAPAGWELKLESNEGNVQSNAGGYEAWHTGAATLSQELRQLKDGYYRLTANAYYRHDDVNAVITAVQNGDEPIVDAYLFAGKQSAPVHFWLDPAQVASEEENTASGLAGLECRISDEDVRYAPNNGGSAQNFFAADRYTDVTVQFGYDSAAATTVKVGMYKTGTYANAWLYFDDFRLYYLGTEAPVAVQDIDADQHAAAPAALFSLDGRQQLRLTRGVNIVRMADGTVRKVMVK